MAPSIGSQIDQAIGTLSSSFDSLFDAKIGGRRVLPFVTAGALALLGASYIGASSGSRRGPRIAKAPQPVKDEPYPYDIYEGGHVLETPYGNIRYFELGPKGGSKVMLVHGISTPAPVWHKLVPKLVAAGHRILIFDLFGRGYSDSPALPHDVALYVTQISLLLAALPEWKTFSIAGMSLGGPIAANFAHFFPERIEKIYLICPAGGTAADSLPLVRRLFVSLPPSMMRTFVSGGPINPAKDPKSIGAWQAANHKGFWFSFISSLRNGPIFDQAEVLQAVTTKFGSRVKAIWGDADSVVPFATKEFFGPLNVQTVPGGDHWIVVTHGDEVAASLVAHLASP